MIKKIINRFIADSENIKDKKVREKYFILSGILGLICNVILFSVKLIIGIVMNSIAIISDSFNNLSDTGTSFVSIISAKMSNRKPDRQHPYGHGRIEYISSFIVSVVIMLVGFELLRTSIDKTIHPEEVKFSLPLILILTISLSVKMFMYVYNRYMGNKINSELLVATSADSINDVFSTSAVIISTIVGYFIPFKIDGYIGIVVSIFVIISGFKIAKSTIDLLIGTPPDMELVKKLEKIVINSEGIIGVHDLIIHDYGPGRMMASIHAEVPDNANIIKVHEQIDKIEQDILNTEGIQLVIHMDPISVNCEETISTKKVIVEICKSVNENFTIHDFRMIDGENQINLIFDLVVPFEIKQSVLDENLQKIEKMIKEKDSRYKVVIKAENNYN